MHGDCQVHLALTKALKASVVDEQLAQPLDISPTAVKLVQRTQARSKPRPLPTLDA